MLAVNAVQFNTHERVKAVDGAQTNVGRQNENNSETKRKHRLQLFNDMKGLFSGRGTARAIAT